jgi:hypothetical protein
MTTIISNGYYLLADHRRAIHTRDSAVLITENRIVRLDDTDKLIVGNKLMVNGKRLLAYASSGDTRKFEFINELNCGSDNCDLYVFLKTCIQLPHIYFDNNSDTTTLIGITEDFKTIKIEWLFSLNRTHYGVTEYENGDLVVGGSGGVYIDGLLSGNKSLARLSLEELMNIAAIRDESTSSSYGVFGARENHKFAHVLGPSKETSILMYNQTIEKLKLPT